MKVTVSVDRLSLTVPEALKLTITVESQRGVEITLPEFGEIIGDFGVTDVTDAKQAGDDFILRNERVYTLESFVAGECAIPAIHIAFADHRQAADGSQVDYDDTVTTEPIMVTVREGLADIKGPATMPMPRRTRLLLWALGVVAAMMLIALLARWRRRRGRSEAKPTKALHVPPHEWALGELEKLAALNLVRRGLIQEYYYRLNGLMRRYIELRFEVMAGEQTSEEFVRALQHSTSFDECHKEVLRRFVAACDPVKYARQQPEPSEIDWVQATVRDFILQTAQTSEGSGRAVATGTAGQEGSSL